MQYPRSNPPPVECFIDWRDNTGEGTCVQIAHGPEGWVAMRDSKDEGAGPVLRFTAVEWAAFREGVLSGTLS